MNFKIPFLVVALLLGGVGFATPASAQGDGYANLHRGWLRPGDRLGGGAGFHGRVGGGGWVNGGAMPGTTYGGVNPAAIAQFDARAGQVRGEIGARLSARAISPMQAQRLNQELSSLMAMRAQYTASGGAGGAMQFSELNRRLVQLQMGLRSPIQF